MEKIDWGVVEKTLIDFFKECNLLVNFNEIMLSISQVDMIEQRLVNNGFIVVRKIVRDKDNVSGFLIKIGEIKVLEFVYIKRDIVTLNLNDLLYISYQKGYCKRQREVLQELKQEQEYTYKECGYKSCISRG